MTLEDKVVQFLTAVQRTREASGISGDEWDQYVLDLALSFIRAKELGSQFLVYLTMIGPSAVKDEAVVSRVAEEMKSNA